MAVVVPPCKLMNTKPLGAGGQGVFFALFRLIVFGKGLNGVTYFHVPLTQMTRTYGVIEFHGHFIPFIPLTQFGNLNDVLLCTGTSPCRTASTTERASRFGSKTEATLAAVEGGVGDEMAGATAAFKGVSPCRTASTTERASRFGSRTEATLAAVEGGVGDEMAGTTAAFKGVSPCRTASTTERASRFGSRTETTLAAVEGGVGDEMAGAIIDAGTFIPFCAAFTTAEARIPGSIVLITTGGILLGRAARAAACVSFGTPVITVLTWAGVLTLDKASETVLVTALVSASTGRGPVTLAPISARSFLTFGELKVRGRREVLLYSSKILRAFVNSSFVKKFLDA